jgi:RND family efflux transporter MFP subunit
MALLVMKRKQALKAAAPYGMRPLAVHVVEARVEPLEKVHSYLGTVESCSSAAISSRVSARVESVAVDEGSAVKAGDLLLKLDQSDITARIAALDSTISGLETNRAFWVAEDERNARLAKDGVIPAAEAQATHNRMTEATSKLNSAVSERSTLQTQLAYTTMRAPADGIVTARLVDPGDLALPGHPLVELDTGKCRRVAFKAPQADAAFISKGGKVAAKIDGKDVELKITAVYPALDRARMFRVEARLPDETAVKTGSFVPLRFVHLHHAEALVLPENCLLKKADGSDAVFVVKKNTLKLMNVKRLAASDGKVEISGISAGDKVVASTFLGWANLADGLKVEVAK